MMKMVSIHLSKQMKTLRLLKTKILPTKKLYSWEDVSVEYDEILAHDYNQK